MMEEKKYHIKNIEGQGMVSEPTPTYRSAVAEPQVSVSRVMDWDEEVDDEFNTDSYPLGRSLEQVKAHCESILDKLNDPNYGEPIEKLNAKIAKMIAGWK